MLCQTALVSRCSSLLLCRNRGIVADWCCTLFWSGASGFVILIYNRDGASAGFFSLPTQIGSNLTFPARHNSPMRRLNLQILEVPCRPLNNKDNNTWESFNTVFLCPVFSAFVLSLFTSPVFCPSQNATSFQSSFSISAEASRRIALCTARNDGCIVFQTPLVFLMNVALPCRHLYC